MKLQLGGLVDHAKITIIVEYVDLVGALTAEDLKKKKEHNQKMLEIESILSFLSLMISKTIFLQRKCGIIFRPYMEEIQMS